LPQTFLFPLRGIVNDKWAQPFLQHMAGKHDRGFFLATGVTSVTDRTQSFGTECAETPVIIRLAAQLLDLPAMALGVDSLPFPRLTNHSFRHFLPSLADVAALDPDRSNLLGRWKPSKNREGTMSRTYSSARTRVTVQVIFALRRCILCAKSRVPAGQMMSLEHISPSDLTMISIAESAKHYCEPSTPAAASAGNPAFQFVSRRLTIPSIASGPAQPAAPQQSSSDELPESDSEEHISGSSGWSGSVYSPSSAHFSDDE